MSGARFFGPPAESFAEVAELVDALDLGSSAARCESSSLSFRTILIIPAVGSLFLGVYGRDLADPVVNPRMFEEEFLCRLQSKQRPASSGD